MSQVVFSDSGFLPTIPHPIRSSLSSVVYFASLDCLGASAFPESIDVW